MIGVIPIEVYNNEYLKPIDIFRNNDINRMAYHTQQ